MYIYIFFFFWKFGIYIYWKKRTQDTPKPAGIKNPSGEKAIGRWGQGAVHPKNRHGGDVNTSPAIKVSPFSTFLLYPCINTAKTNEAHALHHLTHHG